VGVVFEALKNYPIGVDSNFQLGGKMDKIQKAIAKLYFALGEQKKQIPANMENPAFFVEYLASAALRDSGRNLGVKYFTMGAAAAHRFAQKPPRGKSNCGSKPVKPLPPQSKRKKIRQGTGKTRGRGYQKEQQKLIQMYVDAPFK